MNWDLIQNDWGEYRVAAKRRWAKLGELQLQAIGGRRDLLARRIKETYGLSLEETENQLKQWQLELGTQRVKPR